MTIPPATAMKARQVSRITPARSLKYLASIPRTSAMSPLLAVISLIFFPLPQQPCRAPGHVCGRLLAWLLPGCEHHAQHIFQRPYRAARAGAPVLPVVDGLAVHFDAIGQLLLCPSLAFAGPLDLGPEAGVGGHAAHHAWQV